METRPIHKITMACLAVVLGLPLHVPSAVLAQQDEWNELNQRAVKLHRQGKTAEAIPSVNALLNLLRRSSAGNECCVPGIHGICAMWIITCMLVVVGLWAMLHWTENVFHMETAALRR
ncbi:MAG: hypothetical protein AB1733_24700 [Thermodesulfobacteriota bacterium]